MKYLLILSILFTYNVCIAQKYETRPCSLDTIKGVIIYQDNFGTHSTIIEGYYIAYCGGYQIGNFYEADNFPTFIPAYFIRNDEMINGVRKIHDYKKQRNTGKFTDEHFKVIPFESVYGLLQINIKNKK